MNKAYETLQGLIKEIDQIESELDNLQDKDKTQ